MAPSVGIVYGSLENDGTRAFARIRANPGPSQQQNGAPSRTTTVSSSHRLVANRFASCILLTSRRLRRAHKVRLVRTSPYSSCRKILHGPGSKHLDEHRTSAGCQYTGYTVSQLLTVSICIGFITLAYCRVSLLSVPARTLFPSTSVALSPFLIFLSIWLHLSMCLSLINTYVRTDWKTQRRTAKPSAACLYYKKLPGCSNT